jgi:hypothetical protein
MLYTWKVRALKVPRFNRLWRGWRARRGETPGDYASLPEYVREYAPRHSFADIGCMWGVNGEHAFIAEAAGATRVTAVDVFGPTPEFERAHRTRQSLVEFVLGDITRSATLDRIGVVDVVLCAGVLYHHPSPFDLLVALRRICRLTLILRTSTIPEVGGLPNAAVFYPALPPARRQLWDLRSLGVAHQAGISDAFEAAQGYGNWFWGLTPSCLTALVETAGFKIDRRAPEAFATTLVCTPVAVPFEHQLPEPQKAREIGVAVSAARGGVRCI